jgi:hypothetical protein
MLFTLFALALLLLASLPTVMVIRNLALFQRAPQEQRVAQERLVSVLIPARNEEQGIAAAVGSVAASSWRELEIIVLDDHSSDGTAAIVQTLADSDPRIRLVNSPELPPGWNGKQHACWQAAQLGRGELLLFMDADVRLQSEAIARCVAELDLRRTALLSGFPNQEQGTLSEAMLIPLMYVVLLGYLPLDQMRTTKKPEFGAGCGQLFLAERSAYFACGGHQAIAASRHDGLKLPRAFRAAGLMTDLFDASDSGQRADVPWVAGSHPRAVEERHRRDSQSELDSYFLHLVDRGLHRAATLLRPRAVLRLESPAHGIAGCRHLDQFPATSLDCPPPRALVAQCAVESAGYPCICTSPVGRFGASSHRVGDRCLARASVTRPRV